MICAASLKGLQNRRDDAKSLIDFFCAYEYCIGDHNEEQSLEIMSEFEAHLGLLPTGFVDLMPEEAEKEASAIQALMSLFTGYGYLRIKPPLMEFEESLFAPGPGASLTKDTFRVMDPVSRRMLGVRADITPQIARIVCTRLPQDQSPMRLTYANDVLRASAGQLRTARQFTQVGCEIAGDDSRASYAESATLAILGLKRLGVHDITLDITLPRLPDALLDQWGLEPATRTSLLNALDKRDRDGIAALDFEGKGCILSLLDATGYAADALDKVSALDLPKTMKVETEKLTGVVADIQVALDQLGLDDVRLTFDAFETKGFEYHSGIAFSLFAKGLRGELGRGGHYSIRFGAAGKSDDTSQDDTSQKAIGFTLYMDTIRSALSRTDDKKILAVPLRVGWGELETLRSEGWTLVRMGECDDIPDRVTHIYKNGKPEER